MLSSTSPLISIIVPAYNVAIYIGEALQSVVEQDFENYEIIVINDGSTDTPDLELALEPFGDRIVYLQQPNGGISAARNAGLRVARGELIALLDSDDIWLPGKLTEQLEFMRSGDYDMVYADALLFGEIQWPEGTTFMDRSPSNGPVTLLSLLDLQATPVVSTVIMRKDLVLKAGCFDESDRTIPEDYDLWLRMVQVGARIGYQQKPLAKYRYRSDSLSASRVKLHSGALRVLQKARRDMKLSPEELAALSKTEQRLQSTITIENSKDMIVKGEVDAAASMLSQARESNKSWKIPVALFLLRTFPGLLRNYLRRTHQPH
ncbi:MAG TPA: glycosyltransferase family A protein [Pyrinomonadaceae bacterium]|nr:glycosyltransferase family A protein [Pyrinomonadaceae bacterium]